LGWLLHKSRSRDRIAAQLPVFRPILIFSLFLLVSLVITLFRHSNFYPLLSDHPYELVTNVNGVSSGGAMMSALFSFLNYLSGFLFFLIIIDTVRTRVSARKILVALLISTLIALAFGLYQLFSDVSFGNLPSRAFLRP